MSWISTPAFAGELEPESDSEDDSGGGLFEAAVAGEDVGGEGDFEPEDSEDEETSAGLFESSVAGEDEDDGEARGLQRSVGGFDFSIGGHVRGDVWMGKVPDTTEHRADIKAAYGELALLFTVKKPKFGSAYADIRFRPGYENDSWAPRLNMREAYANLYLGPFDFRFGQQIIVWGRADGINPTNVLTPMNLSLRSPNEDDRRMGNLALHMTLNLSPVRIEGAWLPLYRPTQLPQVAVDEGIEIHDPKFPDPELRNGTYAGRFHLEFPSFETSVSYVYGPGVMAAYSLNHIDVVEGSPVIKVSRTSYHRHLIGFDFSTAIGDIMGLRGEFAFRRPINYENLIQAPNPDLQYVIGVDREFGNLTIIAQYYGRYVIDWQPIEPYDNEIDPSQLKNLTLPLAPAIETRINQTIDYQLRVTNRLINNQKAAVQHLASLRFEWKMLHETLSLSAFALANFTTNEWVIYPKAAYLITDGLLLSAGAELYFGPKDTLLDLVDERLTAGFLELKYMF